MTALVRDHATYEDLLKVPENMVAELIEGQLYASPRPAGPHTNALSALGFFLGPAFQFGRGGPGGWWIHVEPEVHFGRNVLVPDLGGWRRERMPEYPRTRGSSTRCSRPWRSFAVTATRGARWPCMARTKS